MIRTSASIEPGAAPASYAWEASDESVAERYGLPLEAIARFDLNTAPTTPGYVQGILASGRFEAPLSGYPPGDYRRLIEAAARAYGVGRDEVVVGAGADEVLDMCAKAFLPPGGSALIPIPTYAMYRVLTEQRPARGVSVARLGPRDGYALDVAALRAAAREVDLVWLCDPNNPTGLAEPAGAIRALLDALVDDAASEGRTPPTVILDEAYAEFVGSTLLSLRERYRRLVVVRTASKAYGLAGFRVGFGIAVPETLDRLALYRPPGSVSIVSATVVAEGLDRPADVRGNVERTVRERGRLAAALTHAGWDVAPSVTNFLLVDFGAAGRATAVADALRARGLVVRTFGAEHPLAGHLRITVRAPDEDDRLIAAAREIGHAYDIPAADELAPRPEGR